MTSTRTPQSPLHNDDHLHHRGDAYERGYRRQYAEPTHRHRIHRRSLGVDDREHQYEQSRHHERRRPEEQYDRHRPYARDDLEGHVRPSFAVHLHGFVDLFVGQVEEGDGDVGDDDEPR